jgi:hypothetical protein
MLGMVRHPECWGSRWPHYQGLIINLLGPRQEGEEEAPAAKRAKVDTAEEAEEYEP